MPLPIALAHRLARRLDDVRRQKVLPDLGPDGKVLVAVEFEDRRPMRVHTVVVNVQHAEAVGIAGTRGSRVVLEGDIREAVLKLEAPATHSARAARTSASAGSGAVW
jgi:S-adenosylmethionine synthetase